MTSVRSAYNIKKIIVITGIGGAGKSTYAASLARDISADVISLDDVICGLAPAAKAAGRYAFDVYRPSADQMILELKRQFTDTVRKLIAQSTRETVLCDGYLRDATTLRDIVRGFEHETVYVRPATLEIFQKNTMARVEREFAARDFCLKYIWRPAPKAVLDACEAHGVWCDEFVRYVREAAIAKFDRIDLELQELVSSDLDVKIINVDY